MPDRAALARHTVFGAGLTIALGVVAWLFVQLRPVTRLDARASRSMHSWALDNATIEGAARVVTRLGAPPTLVVIVVVAAGWLWSRGRNDLATRLVVVALVGAVTEVGLKVVIGRTRPDLDTVFVLARGSSFPSGHAMNSAIVLGAVAIGMLEAARARGRIVATALTLIAVLAIGLSRPVLGVHFVSDVVVGWVLAAIWLAVMHAVPTDTIDLTRVSSEHRASA